MALPYVAPSSSHGSTVGSISGKVEDSGALKSFMESAEQTCNEARRRRVRRRQLLEISWEVSKNWGYPIYKWVITMVIHYLLSGMILQVVVSKNWGFPWMIQLNHIWGKHITIFRFNRFFESWFLFDNGSFFRMDLLDTILLDIRSIYFYL